MDHACRVRGNQPGDNRANDPQRFGYRQLANLCDERRQVSARDVRHRDVLDAVDLAQVVDAHDILVRDLAREQELTLEAPFDFLLGQRIPNGFRPNHLQGDDDFELLVPRLIHGAHSADAEQPDDRVASKMLTDCQRTGFGI